MKCKEKNLNQNDNLGDVVEADFVLESSLEENKEETGLSIITTSPNAWRALGSYSLLLERDKSGKYKNLYNIRCDYLKENQW